MVRPGDKNPHHMGLMVAMNPLFNRVLMQMTLPKFGGKPEDWPGFKQAWGKYLEIFISTQDQEIPDKVQYSKPKSLISSIT